MKRIITITLFLVLVTSCGGSNITGGEGGPIEPPNRAQELAESGWQKYTAADYDSAIILFNDSKKADANYLDAYNGLGWSYFRDHNLLHSLSNFQTVLDVDSTLVDAHVGYAISAFERSEYTESINSIVFVVTQDSASFDMEGIGEYAFVRDQDITSTTVRKILALSYYYSGQFTEAYTQLITFLNPLSTIDPEAETFHYDLFQELLGL